MALKTIALLPISFTGLFFGFSSEFPPVDNSGNQRIDSVRHVQCPTKDSNKNPDQVNSCSKRIERDTTKEVPPYVNSES